MAMEFSDVTAIDMCRLDWASVRGLVTRVIYKKCTFKKFGNFANLLRFTILSLFIKIREFPLTLKYSFLQKKKQIALI